MITVDARVLGQRKPLVPQWSVPFPPEYAAEGERLTLRALISRIVLEEVEAFRRRQADRQLVHVLTAAQVAEGALRGKINPGGQELDQEVDADAAVATALQAFEDGLYLVILDGEEQRSLDREVFLKPESRLTFLRLVMLAGG